MTLLIKNGHLIDPKNNIDGIFDILVENNLIKKIAKNLTEADEVIDASEKYVAPGLVDMHVHLRDPGFTYKEDIKTGTVAAAMGGVTSVCCMPNTKPVCDNKEVLEYINKAEKIVNVYPIASVTYGQNGEKLTDFSELISNGAVAFSDDGRPVADSKLMKTAIKTANDLDKVVISHCEELSLAKGSMNLGKVSQELGYSGIPNSCEEIMVTRDIIVAAESDSRVHIAHISTKGSVDAVRYAKSKGVKVTCETCPHYFTLCDEDVKKYGTNAKMNPPLRDKADRQAIIDGIADGTIDAIVTDHAPHSADEKNKPFESAPNGITGIETSFSLGVTYLVKNNIISLMELINKMSTKPAQILGIDKGGLDIGKPCDLFIFDLDKKYTVDKEKMHSKSKNTPFDKFELYAKPEYTIVNGKVVVKDGEYCGE